ncbi:hypothetical protein D3C71_2027530 [compost metagenome]
MREVIRHDLQTLVQAHAYALQQFQKIHKERQFSGDSRSSTGGNSAEHPFRPHEADHEEHGKREDDRALFVLSAPESKGQQGQQDRQQDARD